MLTAPRVGQSVQAWYNAKAAPFMPLHGKIGTVVIRGRGKPRNHGVDIGGTMYVVPCGNIRKIEV